MVMAEVTVMALVTVIMRMKVAMVELVVMVTGVPLGISVAVVTRITDSGDGNNVGSGAGVMRVMLAVVMGNIGDRHGDVDSGWGINDVDGGDGDGGDGSNILVLAEVMVMVAMGLTGVAGLPVRCTSWDSPPSCPVHHGLCPS